MVFTASTVLCAVLGHIAVSGALTWGTTEFLFTFGDSYTTDGFNVSAGVNSPVPGFVRPQTVASSLLSYTHYVLWK